MNNPANFVSCADETDAVNSPTEIKRDSLLRLLSNIDQFRTSRSKQPLRPYESLETGPRSRSPGFRGLIDRYLAKGYERQGLSIPSVWPPIDWFAVNRSFSFWLNAWEPVTDFLTGYREFGDPRYFEVSRAYIWDWITTFQLPSFSIGPDPLKLNERFGPAPWYDMGVGLRAYRIAYFLDELARDVATDDADIELLIRSLAFHLDLLARDDFYKSHSNHGFYQALGELAATRRFADEPFFAPQLARAKSRIAKAIDQQFHPGGIHREHSPGYHYMLTGTMIGARNSGLIDDATVLKRLSLFEEILTWQIQPNGRVLTFGDTDPRDMSAGAFYADYFENPRLQYHISGGLIGERPREGLLSLPQEGYAFARSDYPINRGTEPWWYLAQIASFHSRTHKHADDLSFVWSDRGAEILIDPARFAYMGSTPEPESELSKQGFWYSDPHRIYVESTRAHNTVEIDHKSYNRRRKPYGSALLYAGKQDGLIVTECELWHSRTVRHWRLLVMLPNSFLVVIDWLLDRSGVPHDYRQFFHFDPAWKSVRRSAGDRTLEMRRDDTELRLAVLPLLPEQEAFASVRGETEPELSGWCSDKAYSLIPCTTLVSGQKQVDFAVFATLFTFATNSTSASATVRKSMRPSVFSWTEGNEAMSLEITRGSPTTPLQVLFQDGSRTRAHRGLAAVKRNEDAGSCT